MVCRDFYWKGITDSVNGYVSGCLPCAQNKIGGTRHKTYGFLHPLRVASTPWSEVLMDHIDQLPLSRGCDAILVVVNRFSKQAVFVPTTTKATSKDLAYKYRTRIFSQHGVPSNIVSDQGSKFASEVWQDLC